MGKLNIFYFPHQALWIDKDRLKGDSIFKVLSDGRLRGRVGEEGRKLMRAEFGWDKVVLDVKKVYLSLIRPMIL